MNCDPRKPTETFLRSIDIHTLLPQQEPFVMISRLVQFDMVRTVTETDIAADNLFVDEGHFSASGLIENIAQTCAARLGYVNKYIEQKGVQQGFIGAVRNLKVMALPKVGDTISTTVDVRDEVFGMTLADAVVKMGDQILLTTEIKIAVKEEARSKGQEASSEK
jgi:predicted hotdog family 3-hydroxylacyl-ACP dehydratase